MKPSAKINSLMVTGSVFLMLGVFAKPLGIPSGFDSIPILVAMGFIFGSYRTMKRAQAAGQISAASDSKKRKRFVLLVVFCAGTSITTPFLLPLTGVVLPFGELVAISIISFFISIGAVWFGIKRA